MRPGGKTLSNKRHQEWIRQKREWTVYECFILEKLIDQVKHTPKKCQKVETHIGMEITKNPQMLALMRKGNRNVAVAAIGRKMVMLIWHLLKGHKVELLESTKSKDTKFRKILAMIGKEGRDVIDLPKKAQTASHTLTR